MFFPLLNLMVSERNAKENELNVSTNGEDGIIFGKRFAPWNFFIYQDGRDEAGPVKLEI